MKKDETSNTNAAHSFADRLRHMRTNFLEKVHEVHVEYAEKPDDTLNRMAMRYQKMAHFVELLAQSAERNGVEIGPDDVTFSKKMPLPKGLKEYISEEYDQRLIYEIKDMRGNFNDGDPADFIKQIQLYTDKLCGSYKLSVGPYHGRG